MRTFLSTMVVLVTAILLAGCEESPTNGGGGPPPVVFGVTTSVSGDTVSVEVKGGTKMYTLDMGCYVQDPNTSITVWARSSNQFENVGPGTYLIVEDRSLHNYDRACGRGTRKVRVQEVLTVGVPVEHLYDVTLGSP